MIRRATVDDLPTLARLNHEVQLFHARLEPDVYRISAEADLLSQLSEILEGPGGEGLIYERDGAPIGYALMRFGRHEATPFLRARSYLYVDQLGVAAGARRRGVGRALMAAIQARAASLGADAVELDVRALNDSARAFYSSLGYMATRVSLRRPTLPGDVR